MSHHKFKRWYISVVKGEGIQGDPRRPLIADLDHKGSWQAVYNEDESIAMVLFESDDPNRFDWLKDKIPEVAWAHPLLPERARSLKLKVEEKTENPKNTQLKAKLTALENSGWEELANDEVEEVGKIFHPLFNRVKIETARPSEMFKQ